MQTTFALGEPPFSETDGTGCAVLTWWCGVAPFRTQSWKDPADESALLPPPTRNKYAPLSAASFFSRRSVVAMCLFASVAPSARRARVPAVLAEACANAASNLTNTDTEFVRQALVAPETVAEVLEILYLGGGREDGSSDGVGGDGIEGRASGRGSKRAAACRLNSARVLRSIFSKADGFDVARWARCKLPSLWQGCECGSRGVLKCQIRVSGNCPAAAEKNQYGRYMC